MYRLSDAVEEPPRGEQYVQSYCTQVMQMWTECLKEQIKTKATLKTYCIDRCEYPLSKDNVKVMWGTQISWTGWLVVVWMATGLSTAGPLYQHFIHCYWVSKLHSEHWTVQVMMNISTSAENISTISKSLTCEGGVQLCTRSCLGSPWHSQIPTSGVHQHTEAQTLLYP